MGTPPAECGLRGRPLALSLVMTAYRLQIAMTHYNLIQKCVPKKINLYIVVKRERFCCNTRDLKSSATLDPWPAHETEKCELCTEQCWRANELLALDWSCWHSPPSESIANQFRHASGWPKAGRALHYHSWLAVMPQHPSDLMHVQIVLQYIRQWLVRLVGTAQASRPQR